MMNTFNNDSVHISTKWLLRLITNRGLQVQHILRVIHTATGATHHLAVLPDKRYICDCCMGMNLGVPCRHYFRVWIDMPGMPFHLGLIRPRSVYILLHNSELLIKRNL